MKRNEIGKVDLFLFLFLVAFWERERQNEHAAAFRGRKRGEKKSHQRVNHEREERDEREE
jgi:hypothetical protein